MRIPALVLGGVIAACGGGVDAQKPLQRLPPPTLEPALGVDPASTASTAPSASKPSAGGAQKALVGAFIDALNAHDPAKYALLYADDATLIAAGTPAPIKGKDALIAGTKKLFEVFPSATFAVARAWSASDVLVLEWVMNAKHSGEFMGVKPTDKPVGITGASVMWVTGDGKINEEHRYADDATLLGQIGGAPKGFKARAVPALPASVEWHGVGAGAGQDKSEGDDEKNVEIAKSSYAAFEKKDDKAFGERMADDVAWDDQMAAGPTKGRGEALKLFKGFTAAFPDVKMQTTNAWGVEDFAIVEVVASGTQKGAFMGIPASGKAITLHGLDVLQLKDAKVEKGWSYGSGLELFAQTGSMGPRSQREPGGKAPVAKLAAKPAPVAQGKPAAPKAPAKPPAPKK